MFGRNKDKGGTATVDGKSEAVASAIDEMVSKFRTLKRDAWGDLCSKGKKSFDDVIEATQDVANVLRGDTSSRPIVDPAYRREEQPTVSQLEHGRTKVKGWVEDTRREVEALFRSEPAETLKSSITSKLVTLSGKIGRLGMDDLR
jgi:hypothetical protein